MTRCIAIQFLLLPALVHGAEIKGVISKSTCFIVFTSQEANDRHVLYRIDLDGKNREALATHRELVIGPVVSPDGKRIAYHHLKTVSDMEIMAVAADGTGGRNLTNHSASESICGYSPDGKILISSNRGRNGPLLYVMDADGGNLRQRDGELKRLDMDLGGMWSPDGRKILFSISPESSKTPRELYTLDADGSNLTQLTNLGRVGPGSDDSPGIGGTWSPDGKQIALMLQEKSSRDPYLLHVMNADGTGMRKLTDLPMPGAAFAWCADGRRIYFQSAEGSNPRGLHSVALDGSNLRTVLEMDFGVVWFRLGPDGKWLLAMKQAGGKPNGLYVGDSDGKGMRKLTDIDSITSAAWSPCTGALSPASGTTGAVSGASAIETVKMPSVVGMSARDAKANLVNAGFSQVKFVAVAENPRSKDQEFCIQKQDPSAGAISTGPTPVTLYVYGRLESTPVGPEGLTVAARPTTEPPRPPVTPTTPPATTSPPAIAASPPAMTAPLKRPWTALDSYAALLMSIGRRAQEPNYDVDSDGKVTSSDSRKILHEATKVWSK